VGCLPDSATDPDGTTLRGLTHDPHETRHPSLKGEIARLERIAREIRKLGVLLGSWETSTAIGYNLIFVTVECTS
jgi:hypothetical protein